MIQKLKKHYLFYIIPIPIFFTSNGVFKGDSYDTEAFALPFSLFIFLITFAFNKNYVRVLFKRDNMFLISYVYFSIISFLLKVIFSGSDFMPTLLMISILPFVVSYCIGYSLKPDFINNLNNIMNNAVRVFFVFALLYLISSFVSFGAVGAFANRGEDSIFDMFSIYQKLVYFPTMLSCFFVFSLFSTLKYKYLYSLVLIVSVLMTGAREGILICLVGIVMIIMVNLKSISIQILIKSILFSVVSIVLITYFIEPINDILESATFLSKITSMGGSGDITAGRAETILNVFSDSRKDFSLFIGTGYSMNLGEFGSPHNQYGEILLRSGFFGLSLFILFILFIIKKMRANILYFRYTNVKSTIYSFSIVLMCILIISFNVNVPMRAPYTSILFGFLCGFFNNTAFVAKSMSGTNEVSMFNDKLKIQ